MKLSISHLCTCLPDYFTGHHSAYLQISVEPKMTLRDVRDRMRETLRHGEIQGGGRLAFLLNGDFVGAANEKEADKAVRAAFAAIARVKGVKPRQRTVDFFEDADRDAEIYAYFAINEV